jgi:methylated-DNA-[protein]-cysteine S-methyltransferase
MPTPFAVLGIRVNDTAITALDYLAIDHAVHDPVSRVAAHAVEAIEHYLDDPAYRFDLPLAPAGTPFQQRVWRAILAIRAGDARTYGALARDLGSEPRAVGQACGSNPIALVIPCHRVTAAGNRLGGFMHSTGDDALRIKRWLLAHEREVVEPTLL